MSSQDRIQSLKAKHADLEERLHAEQVRPLPDDNLLREIKHEKLMVRDEIARIRHTAH